MIAIERNFKVVELRAHEERFTVVIQKDGEPEPRDTHEPVGDYVDPFELHDEGIFGYYDERERQVLLSGFDEDGEERLPRGAKKARRQREEREARDEDAAPAELEGSATCRLCGEEKPASEFSRYARAKTGRRNYCKDCAREAARKSRAKSLLA